MPGTEYAALRAKIESTFFRNGMLRHLDSYDPAALNHYLNLFLPELIRSTDAQSDQLIDDFFDMTLTVLRKQHEFNLSGVPDLSFDPEQYMDRDFMEKQYLNGLTLALLFWPGHWNILRYFEERLLPIPLPKTGRMLDLGTGHGLYSAKFAQRYPAWDVEALDISPFSVSRAEALWKEFNLPANRLKTHVMDMFSFNADKRRSYQVILFSELIKHLPDPDRAMKYAADSLAEDGIVFFTTGLNVFFFDHLTYFHTLDEVTSLAERAGLKFLDLRVTGISNTPHGPQSDVYGLLVHESSPWLKRVTSRQRDGQLHHIGVLTRNIKQSVARFQSRQAELLYGPVADLRMDCEIAFLLMPDMPVPMELVAPFSPTSRINNRIGANRLDHMCYQVSDLDAAVKTRESQGARLTTGPVFAAAQGRDVAFLIDPEGLLIELESAEPDWII